MNISGKRILLTGGAGFIGSHLAEDLVEAGCEVVVFDNLSSGSRDNLSAIADRVEWIEADVLDHAALSRAARGCQLISHQAAQLEILKCIDDPIYDLRSNTEATINVLRAAKEHGVRRVVYASSACVYGQAAYSPQDEQHPQRPNWAYGISKLAAEHYARLFHQDAGLETVGLRYAIVYGPREWYGRVLSVFLKRALEGLPPVLWAAGETVRDFTYVADVVTAHRAALERNGLRNEVFNVSTGRPTTVGQLAQLVCRTCEIQAEPIFEEIAEGETSVHCEGRMRLPAELKSMVLSPALAQARLDWTPRVALERGLRSEWNWLREHAGRWAEMRY